MDAIIDKSNGSCKKQSKRQSKKERFSNLSKMRWAKAKNESGNDSKEAVLAKDN